MPLISTLLHGIFQYFGMNNWIFKIVKLFVDIAVFLNEGAAVSDLRAISLWAVLGTA